MKSPPEFSQKNLITRKYMIAVVLAMLLLGWLSWDTYTDYTFIRKEFSDIDQMNIVQREIKHLDEVLTMSAQMAAATGNLDWETRYLLFEPELDLNIKRALQHDPEKFGHMSAINMDAAHRALVATERHAFELVRQGKKTEAQRLLSGQEYEENKKIFSDSIIEFDSQVLQSKNSLHSRLLTDMSRDGILTIGVLMLLSVISLIVFSNMRWSQVAVTISNQQLNQKTAELSELNNQLDLKVSERTQELNNSVLASLNMMEDAVSSRDGLESANEQLSSEITERKQSETRVKRLNRVYAVLSGINTLIVRVQERDELFREACRIAVEFGGFPLAWIGIPDEIKTDIVATASTGGSEGILIAIKNRDLLSGGALGRNSMTRRAMREKRPFVSNDTQNDPMIMFRKEHIEYGIHSMAILPLIVSDEALGVFVLYSPETDFFDAEEMKLLIELAGDIAFAIDHIEKQERLNYLAYYDTLTGLANRTLFHERLEQGVISAKEQGRKLALIILDIERFKTINDSLGQQAGDALLKAIAQRMSDFAVDVRRLGRLDADHFMIMVTEMHGAEDLARLIEQRYLQVFGPVFLVGQSELRVTAKFGIAMYPNDGSDADALFRNAEAALKKAKATGDRYLFYTQTMNARIAEKLSLENQLREALDKQEFVLYYQPKVNLASGKVTGAEALIRWNDPRTGLVPPGRFIPILEETGLIYDVGRWALRKAVDDYLRWRNAGLDAVRIAVNVSPMQLRQRDFNTEIEQVLSIDPHAAAGLELEITESLIMENVTHSIASLQSIRDMGVNIAIDDFGTGFSSLSYLSKLPVNILKIDRSFIIEMTVGPEGLSLVSTIINLAHSFKLKVVAEGVETEEQSRLLRILNCDEFQGFLFSKPVPRDEFEKNFLKTTHSGKPNLRSIG